MQHQITTANTGAVRTMSTREIAELIGSQHSHIKISAVRLAGKGVIGTLAVREFAHNGNTYTEYLLNKRDSLVLVAQNCPEFTALIVDRWQELEAQVAQPVAILPDFDNPAIAARAWADQYEQRQAAEKKLALAAPKVEFVDKYVESTGLKSFRQVAKLLKANEARFREFLTKRRVMYKLGGEWVAHQQHIDAGRFEVKAGTSDVSGHAYNSCRFSPKGVQWVAGEWAKHCLEVDA